MPDTEASEHAKSLPDLQWRELCAQLRATDDISFKLLGFVPLLTVAAIAGILVKSEAKFSLPLIVACFVGSLSTLGFWIWERRNIQTCQWLRERAAALERETFGRDYVGQFARFPKSPRGIGKTQGETLVYSVTLAAWLLVPPSTLPTSTIADCSTILLLLLYAVGATAIAFSAYREFSVPIEISPSGPPIEG